MLAKIIFDSYPLEVTPCRKEVRPEHLAARAVREDTPASICRMVYFPRPREVRTGGSCPDRRISSSKTEEEDGMLSPRWMKGTTEKIEGLASHAR